MLEEQPIKETKPIQTWVALALTLAMSAGAIYYISQHEIEVEAFIQHTGAMGPVLSVLLYGMLGISPVPSEILTVIVGAVYGPLFGTLVSWMGNMLAALIEYYIGRRVGHATDFEARRQHLPFGLGRFPADSPWFLILARIIPGYGPKMVGLMGGMYKVSLWRYTWTAALPTLLGAALFAMGGFGLRAVL